MSIRTLPLALALAAATGAAQASSIADLGLTLEQVRALNAQLTAPIAAPGIAFGSPTAFGAGWGQAYMGIGGQTISTGQEDVDGSALVGIGFGDPHELFAFDMAMTVVSLTEGLGQDGNWSFKFHHTFADRSALAVGLHEAAGWGEASDTSTSPYVAYTRVLELAPQAYKRPLTLALNAGVGKERFAGISDDYGAFGSVALAWHRQSSVIADFNGRELGVAISVVPMYRIPLVFTAGLINLTERYEDTEFAAGIGYLHSF